MKKLLLLSALMIFTIACEKQLDCSSSNQIQKEDGTSVSGTNCEAPSEQPDTDVPSQEPEVPRDPSGEVPHEALTFDVKIELYEFDSEDEAKVTKAIEIIKRVVGSKEFKDRVIDFTYNSRKQYLDNNGLTNEQIYQKLLEGKEDLVPEVDNQMDLELELYYSWRSTVGHTYPDALRIYMNTKFFNSYSPAEVAGNVFHEWTHKLGFDHASSYSVARDSSVPYALGYLMEELGKKYE
jgi:hypothetical protein